MTIEQKRDEENESVIPFQIWIDADACPNAIKDILFRTSMRLKIKLTLVANQSARVPKSDLINVITVPYGADIADNLIADQMKPKDIVITGDIPLAARVVENDGIAIGTRGELFDEKTIHSRLASRNLMEQFRSAGIETKGPKPLSQKDAQTFANQLDRLLTKLLKN
jgi:uncharacterized protein YaiI (UPF0178 family)